jgi:hypothetical protein
MAKRASLFEAKKPSKPAAKAAVVADNPAPAATNAAPRPPSRIGKRVLSVYLDPIALKQIRQLALDKDTTVQALGEEAVNLLFLQHKMNRSA